MKAFAGVALAVCLLCVVYLHVWQRVQIIKLGYEIAEKETIIEELVKERRLLRLEYSRISSFERISGKQAGDMWNSASCGIEIVDVLVPRNSTGGVNGSER